MWQLRTVIPIRVLLGVNVHVLSAQAVGDLVFGDLVGLDAVDGAVAVAVGGFGVGCLSLRLGLDAGSYVGRVPDMRLVVVVEVFCR